jgi:hypothetical protein
MKQRLFASVLTAALVFPICGCSAMPHRTITVTDRAGRPLQGVTVTPYPILLFGRGNTTDANGKIAVYDVAGSSAPMYHLRRSGFRESVISFPNRNPSIYVLQRTTQ